MTSTVPPWHLIRDAWWSLNDRVWEALRVGAWREEGRAFLATESRSPDLDIIVRDRALLGLVAVAVARPEVLASGGRDFLPSALPADFATTVDPWVSTSPVDIDAIATRTLVPAGGGTSAGYAAESIRAAAAQSLLSMDAQIWLRESGHDAPPVAIAQAMLEDEAGDLHELGYQGGDRAQLAAIGIEINWWRLTSPAPESYDALAQVRESLTVERDRWRGEKKRLRRKAATLATRGDLEGSAYATTQADLAADHEAEVARRLMKVNLDVRQLELNPRGRQRPPDGAAE